MLLLSICIPYYYMCGSVNKYYYIYVYMSVHITLLHIHIKHILNKIRLFPTQHPSIIVLLNLYAAFDTIDHSILLHRLESIALSGVVITWFTSYLSDRTYSIYIDKYKTKPRTLSHGVPQGSILCPILFNIYIYIYIPYWTYLITTLICTSIYMLTTYKCTET